MICLLLGEVASPYIWTLKICSGCELMTFRAPTLEKAMPFTETIRFLGALTHWCPDLCSSLSVLVTTNFTFYQIENGWYWEKV